MTNFSKLDIGSVAPVLNWVGGEEGAGAAGWRSFGLWSSVSLRGEGDFGFF